MGRPARRLSPGHVDLPVAGSAGHLAEGHPDAHCHHQREGDHASDHVSGAAFRRKRVFRNFNASCILSFFLADLLDFPLNLNTHNVENGSEVHLKYTYP